MLGLQLPTDRRWAELIRNDMAELLTDHAWCEQKAASNAISMIVRYPELSELVTELTRIAQEELDHFGQVVEKIHARGAMIEARSCERFKLLTEEVEDPELRAFYNELMISEAGHYTTFIGFARKHGGRIDVDARWNAFLAYEAEVIGRYGNAATMHG